MKKFNQKIILVFVFIVIICFETNSQSIVNVKILPENPTNQDTVELYSGVFFTFGAPSSCPPLSGCIIIKEDSFVLLNLFFDISGPWPQFGCASCDTSKIGKLDAGNYLMCIIVNTIFESDTNFLEDADTLEFTVINSNVIYESEMVNEVVIYPNPAKDYVVFNLTPPCPPQGGSCNVIKVNNIVGKEVAKLPVKGERTVWDCREVENGIYFYRVGINSKWYSGKLVKTGK